MTIAMNVGRQSLAVGLFLLVAPTANAQVIGSDLMVTNAPGLSAPSFLQHYSGQTGQYFGQFTIGGPQNGAATLRYGPDGSLYVGSYLVGEINRYNPNSGVFIETLALGSVMSSFQFTFGPQGRLYYFRRQGTGAAVGIERTTATGTETFVPAGSGGLDIEAREMAFGPDGNLYVVNNNRVLRYNGLTGASLGTLVTTGSGGLANGGALLFRPDGSLLVSSGGTDQILRYDGVTGAPLGVFASGGGLSVPRGIALGPDGLLYVVSGFTDSVLRFNATTGSFVDTFISQTAGQSPFFLASTPTPIPEPSSCLQFVLASVGLTIIRRRASVASGVRSHQ